MCMRRHKGTRGGVRACPWNGVSWVVRNDGVISGESMKNEAFLRGNVTNFDDTDPLRHLTSYDVKLSKSFSRSRFWHPLRGGTVPIYAARCPTTSATRWKKKWKSHIRIVTIPVPGFSAEIHSTVILDFVRKCPKFSRIEFLSKFLLRSFLQRHLKLSLRRRKSPRPRRI